MSRGMSLGKWKGLKSPWLGMVKIHLQCIFPDSTDNLLTWGMDPDIATVQITAQVLLYIIRQTAQPQVFRETHKPRNQRLKLNSLLLVDLIVNLKSALCMKLAVTFMSDFVGYFSL